MSDGCVRECRVLHRPAPTVISPAGPRGENKSMMDGKVVGVQSMSGYISSTDVMRLSVRPSPNIIVSVKVFDALSPNTPFLSEICSGESR